MALSIEQFQILPIEDLQGIVSDWFKDIHGVRPRHIDFNDKEALLGWIKMEIENPSPIDED